MAEKVKQQTIKFRMQGISGELPLSEAKMHCISKDKYKSVSLGVSHKGSMIVPFAKIILYDTGLYRDAIMSFEDAKKLGEAIAQAWNNSLTDKRD